MAIAPKTDVPESVAQNALNTEPAAEAKPDLSGYSKDELAAMMRADQGGAPVAPQAPVNPESAPPPPPETKQPEAAKQPPQDGKPQIPDKFKNPDGSLNVDNLLKSYLETEKTMSRQFQSVKDLDLIKNENSELRQQMEELLKWKASYESQAAEQEQAEAERQLTDEELAQMTPQQQQEYFRKSAEAAMEAKFKKMEAQREMDIKIQSAIKEVEKMEGYEHLKDDVQSLLQSDILDYHPDAAKIAYYAALGHRTPQIIAQAKNMGFSEGYAKAKEEMGKVVDSGKSQAPVNVEGMSEEQLRKLPLEELAKLLPRYHDSSFNYSR